MALTKQDVSDLHAASEAKAAAIKHLADAEAFESETYKAKAAKLPAGTVVVNHLSGNTAFVRVGDDLFQTPLTQPQD